MSRNPAACCLWFGTLLIAIGAWAPAAGDEPKPIPKTRPEMKRALELLKRRTPRLPLPPPMETTDGKGNPRLSVSNGRARQHYLPEGWTGADFLNDPLMTLSYPFKTEVFWIVSRVNNCHYCLGHQEHKLSAAGLDERTIALLDSNWSKFTPKEQAAFALARKLTLEPWNVGKSDVQKALEQLSEPELIEIVFTISMFNSVNRWTDSLGLPQDEKFRDGPIHFDTPTDADLSEVISTTMVRELSEISPVPSRKDLGGMIRSAAQRMPGVTLASPDVTKSAFSELLGEMSAQSWQQAMAGFPTAGKAWIRALQLQAGDSKLPANLKGLIRLNASVQNRASYALGHALAACEHSGISKQRIPAAIGVADAKPGESLTPEETAVRDFTIKLTVVPQSITDDDVSQLRTLLTDHQVAEVVFLIGSANQFDRFTETLQLPLEPEILAAAEQALSGE